MKHHWQSELSLNDMTSIFQQFWIITHTGLWPILRIQNFQGTCGFCLKFWIFGRFIIFQWHSLSKNNKNWWKVYSDHRYEMFLVLRSHTNLKPWSWMIYIVTEILRWCSRGEWQKQVRVVSQETKKNTDKVDRWFSVQNILWTVSVITHDGSQWRE